VLSPWLTDHHDLRSRRVPAGKSREHQRNHPSRAAGMGAIPRKRALRLAPRLLVVDKMRQCDQVEDRYRARRRFCTVVVFLQSEEDRRVLPGGAKPSSLCFVPEEEVLARLKVARPFEPSRNAVGLEQLEQSPDERRVVFRICVDGGLAVTISSQQALFL